MGFLCCLIPGAKGGIPTLYKRGQTKHLKVLPGSGNTIQSVIGGFCFTGGCKQKGVKKEAKDPLCHRKWVIPVWSAWGPAEHPCTAVQVPAVVPNHRVAAGSALVWAKAAAGCFVHGRD